MAHRFAVSIGSAVALLAFISASAARPPEAGIKVTDGGKFIRTEWRPVAEGHFEFESAELRASLYAPEPYLWRLELTPKQSVTEVWFPWEQAQAPLNADVSDDVVYVPAFCGALQKMDVLKEWDWKGSQYPGGSFAPLLVVADRSASRMVAAANWPPRNITPMFSRNRLTLVSHEPLPPLRRQTYSIFYRAFEHDPRGGGEAWHAAVDLYREWLQQKLRSENLFPPRYSEFLWRAPGWLNFQLSNWATFDPPLLEQYHAKWSPHFPWVQFWGQMSNYAGPAANARPAVAPGEECGCCVGRREVHPRYQPKLSQLIQRFRAAGTRVGFYARPPDPYQQLRLDDSTLRNGETNLQWMLEWVRMNRETYGTDGVYLDTLGGYCYAAEPLFIARMLRDQCPIDTVVECPLDVYPAAFLLSGATDGGVWSGGKARFLEGLTPKAPRLAWPRLARYLLSSHVVFLGESNRDWDHWGPAADFWAERQAFLLGAKLDVMTPAQDAKQKLGPMNEAVAEILTEWKQSDFWNRHPEYADTRGISDVPAGVDVRRFSGRSGETVLAVENWRRQLRAECEVDGKRVSIPPRRLSIVVLPAGG